MMHLRFVAGSLQLRHLSSSVSARDLHVSLGILSPTSTDKHPRIAKNEGLLHWGAPEHSLSCTDRRKQSAGSTCSGLSALVRFPMPILSSSSGQTYPNKICTMVGSPAAETQDRHRKVFERHQSPRRTSCRPAYRTGVHHSTREVVLFRSPPALFSTNLF